VILYYPGFLKSLDIVNPILQDFVVPLSETFNGFVNIGANMGQWVWVQEQG